MPICPDCESRDVRRSHRRRSFDFVHHWRGLCMYRCNECRGSFYAPQPVDASAKLTRRLRGNAHWLRRWGLDLLLFLVLVGVFYSIIRFVRE
ncbi:MAG: hypothetical protein ACRD4O_13885 [Bryobacteraceae bacterium]